jgi:hypothetical protein
MKIHTIDNSLNNLGKTVLWQYDRAYRLLSLLKHMQVLYHCAVEQFWDFWTTKVLSIDTCGSLGCSVWGLLLGVPRPVIVENGEERLIATPVYRRILKGAFYLMKASSSFEDILGYLEIVFGIGGDDNLSKWSVYVSEYGWTTNVAELNGEYQPKVSYQAGDVVWYENDNYNGNWKFRSDIRYVIRGEWTGKGEPPETIDIPDPENPGHTITVPFVINNSWDSISAYVERTTERVATPDTLILKLYDPEGICRKIGGAPNNSLSISVSYEFGDTTITAVATRRRKCGISLVDNNDMSMNYGKSEFYDEMHKDQKFLFEQKAEEFCPFPLGVKTNEPVGNWVFGLEGQTNELYQSGVAYSKGYIFGYEDENGDGCNWVCKEDISAKANTSFDAIRTSIEKSADGAPFVDGLVEDIPVYVSVRNRITLSVKAMSQQNSVATIISPYSLAEGLDNGIYKIFRNTSDKYLFVCHSSQSEWAGGNPYAANASDVIFVDEPTEENVAKGIGEICKRNGFPVVGYNEATHFIPSVQYYQGMVVKVGNTERVVIRSGRWDSESDFLKNSVPQKKTCLHEYYPYKVLSP